MFGKENTERLFVVCILQYTEYIHVYKPVLFQLRENLLRGLSV